MRNTGDELDSRQLVADSVDFAVVARAHPLFGGSRPNRFGSPPVPAAGVSANDRRTLGRHNWDQ